MKDIRMGKKKRYERQNNLSPDEDKEFSKLYQEYQPFLLKYVSAVVKDRSLAEDIIQETFYEALCQFDKFYDHPNQKGWLINVARFKIKEINRKMHSGELVLLQEESMHPVKSDIGYEMKELETVMSEVFDESEREYFLKYYLWGYSVKELADVEGVTENNMRVKLYRLKEKLSRIMNLAVVLCLTIHFVFIQWIGK